MKAVLHWGPKDPAIFTNFGLPAGNDLFVVLLDLLQVLVSLTGPSRMLGVASVCGWPIEQIFGATTNSLKFGGLIIYVTKPALVCVSFNHAVKPVRGSRKTTTEMHIPKSDDSQQGKLTDYCEMTTFDKKLTKRSVHPHKLGNITMGSFPPFEPHII